MHSRLKRRVAFLIFAVLALTQLGAAFAAPCPMNGEMAMSRMDASDTPCDGCDTPLQSAHHDMPSVCAATCTTSDQPAAVIAVPPVSATRQAVLILKRSPDGDRASRLGAPPSGAPPHRILLHSFLI